MKAINAFRRDLLNAIKRKNCRGPGQHSVLSKNSKAISPWRGGGIFLRLRWPNASARLATPSRAWKRANFEGRSTSLTAGCNLQGKGTSLGGMRPKCTVLDDNGTLAIGKFPNVGDSRSVTRGEVLALRLAAKAGIDAAPARIVVLNGDAVAVIARFDRTADHARIHYLSAASMLQASREEDRCYAEIADVIRARCVSPTRDVQQLWRRMVFNLLITNVDHHLQNHGFLYQGKGQWRLAPAFDINPVPDKDREFKTWLTQDTGPITSLAMSIGNAAYFGLSADAARLVLAEVLRAIMR